MQIKTNLYHIYRLVHRTINGHKMSLSGPNELEFAYIFAGKKHFDWVISAKKTKGNRNYRTEI